MTPVLRRAASADAATLQAILDHPKVLAGATHGFPSVLRLDAGKALRDAMVYMVETPDVVGAFLVERHHHDAEVHTLMLPEARGAVARDAGDLLLEELFLGEGLDMVFGCAHKELRHVALYMRQAGFTPLTRLGDFDWFSCTEGQWVSRSGLCLRSGRRYGERDDRKTRLFGRLDLFLSRNPGLYEQAVRDYNELGKAFGLPRLTLNALGSRRLEVREGHESHPDFTDEGGTSCLRQQ